MHLGFIGFGEVATHLARGLVGKELNLSTFTRTPSKIKARAEALGVKLLPSMEAFIQASEVILSCVWPNEALGVAQQAAKTLTRANCFIDLNSISPMVTDSMEKEIRGSGASFLKVAIMAAIPDQGINTLMLAAGQGGAQVVERLTVYGMNIRFLGDDPKRPAAIKILRSIVLKGIVALLFEMLAGARHFGVDQEVLASSVEVLDRESFMNTANKWVSSTAIHARRRALEMQEAIDTLAAKGLQAPMSIAAREVFTQVAQLGLEKTLTGEDAPVSSAAVLDHLHGFLTRPSAKIH